MTVEVQKMTVISQFPDFYHRETKRGLMTYIIVNPNGYHPKEMRIPRY